MRSEEHTSETLFVSLRAVYREYKNGPSEGLARALRKAKPLVKKEK